MCCSGIWGASLRYRCRLSCGCAEPIDDSRIKIVTNKAHIGRCRVYNRYLRTAGSKYIAFVDASLGFAPQKLAAQYAFLEKHPLVGCLGAQIRSADERRPERYDDIKIALLKHCPFVLSSVVFRTASLVNHGLRFKNEFGDWAFYALMISAARRFRMHNLRDELLVPYPHGRSTDNAGASAHRDRLIAGQLMNFRLKPKKDAVGLHLKLMTDQRLLASELEPMCQWLNSLMELNSERGYYRRGKLYRFFNAIMEEKAATQLS